jgi:hypothetical protein
MKCAGQWNAENIEKLEAKKLPRRPRLHGENKMIMYFKKYDVRVWTGVIWLRIGTSAGTL